MTDDNAKRRRNSRANIFFQERNLDVRLIGTIDNPAFLLNEEIVLNCYVRNFYLLFMSAVNGGDELFRIKLTHVPETLDQEKFMDWLHQYRHRDVYKVRSIDAPNLYISGYAFFDQENKDNSDKVPVFCDLRPKVYFSEEAAQVIIDRFSTEDIKLEIV